MNAKLNLALIAVADRIRDTKKPPEIMDADEKFTEALGQSLAEMLRLKRDPEWSCRWQTDWGTKTNIGLARTILRILEEAI